MLSSTVRVIGYQGHDNDAAGDIFKDALVQHRVSQPRAMTVDFSWMSNFDGVAEHDEYGGSVNSVGVQIIRENGFPSLLATAIIGDLYDHSSCSPQIIAGLPT
ncbi:hypothetical protein BP5796_07616 [Coleophoma crateriformis]|uniref:Uncharacterized protein n=1 Tax=Coleophoma crateriformis TaxID=565419 RepID=A0A3D8RJU6_9HELO|nr:hypothetical protein BP5796_07616 [Coleophoma crateriformis]